MGLDSLFRKRGTAFDAGPELRPVRRITRAEATSLREARFQTGSTRFDFTSTSRGTRRFASDDPKHTFAMKLPEPPVEWKLMFPGEKRTLLRFFASVGSGVVLASGIAIIAGHAYLVVPIVIGGIIIAGIGIWRKLRQIWRESEVVDSDSGHWRHIPL